MNTNAKNIFVPLSIDGINEGEFVDDMNAALLEIQTSLINHVNRYEHKANKAKAQLTVTISLVCLDSNNDSYACAAQIKKVVPAAPPSGSLVMSGVDEATGKPCLICKSSGSNRTNPRQLQLCTEAGEEIDVETGEVKRRRSY